MNLLFFDDFVNENSNFIATKLIPIVNEANKNKQTVNILYKNKKYELTGVVYQHLKTIEFSVQGNTNNIKIKNTDIVELQ